MPTYGYQCTQCQHEFSVFQSMKDAPISICPECGGSPKRLLYPVGVVFKGSGWYINDSRKPEKSEGGETKSDSNSSDKKAGDTKTDTPATTSGDSATSDKTKSETKTPASAAS